MNHIVIRKEAGSLIKAAGVSLKEITSIDYSQGEIDFEVTPMKNYKLMALADESSDSYEMDIEPEDIDRSDTITVVWSIAQEIAGDYDQGAS